MAETAVSLLLEQVGEIVRGHKDLIRGAENELGFLQTQLSTLKALLQDAPKQLRSKNLFKEMERQIKDVVCEVEDIIDTCLSAVAAKRSRRISSMLSRSRRNDLAKQIWTIRKERLGPIFNKVEEDVSAMIAAGGLGISQEDQWMDPKKDQFIRQERVVGFKYEEDTILNGLMEEKQQLDVICIIGMPGLGKTTLAWKIYQSPEVCYAFPIRIWIHVSQRFNRKDVFCNILRKFTSKNVYNMTDQELGTGVRECLEGEKFLLVFDDIWDVEDWRTIENALPHSNAKGRVLVTSRLQTVGTYASSTREAHMLRFLTQDESWDLLQLTVFGNLEDWPQELISIGKHIARNCDGLPIAIVMIGGILLEQFTKKRSSSVVKKEWEKVVENMGMFLQKDKESSISGIVATSYNRLPDNLKECFLYLGVFPEDYEIPAWTLTRLWIAEGFVPPIVGRSLEETAIKMLNDLISSNLLMVVHMNPMGEVKTCRIHDVIHAFCKSKAYEHNMFQEIRISKLGELEPPVFEVDKYRRLSLHSGLHIFLSKTPNGPRVRSFLSFNKEPVDLEPSYISAIPDAFNLLRVLDSKYIRFHQFPQKITKLIHLRYLTLSINALDFIPVSISELWNLQTLVVETKTRALTVALNIWRMIRLRHLKTNAAIKLDPKWEFVEDGGSLQTISRLSPESCDATFSKKAPHLKLLGIRGELSPFLETMSLENLIHLEKLKLMNDSDSLSGDKPQDLKLPQLGCFPQNLKWLTLSNTSLDWKHMSTLAKMETLEVLKLKNNAFTGQSWKAVGDGFKCLQFLLIVATDLHDWEASPDHFPSLRFLVLNKCENLKEIPECVGKHLEKLEIENLRKSAVDSAKRIEAAKKGKEVELGKDKWGVQFKLTIGPGCQH